MKLIEAMIEPERLEAVQEALNEVDVFRLTVSDVEGYALHRKQRNVPIGISRKLKLEIAVNDEALQRTLQAVVKGAQFRSDDASAGKIFVLPLEDVIRIRTGERGRDAV